jgi:hypothetical protein
MSPHLVPFLAALDEVISFEPPASSLELPALRARRTRP